MAKNPAAVALGRRGGLARLKKMTPEQRKAVARKAAETRWAKQKDQALPLTGNTSERLKKK